MKSLIKPTGKSLASLIYKYQRKQGRLRYADGNVARLECTTAITQMWYVS